MIELDQILGEFIEAWKAGHRPDVDECISRAREADRDELALQLSMWLEIAPTPDYDGPTRAAITREPALQAARAAAATMRSPLSERLPRLRQRAGLAVGDVSRRLVAIFALDDEQRATNYLSQVERGDLDPQRLSSRLLDALAAILGADPEQLAPRPATFGSGQSFFRADEDAGRWVATDIDAMSRAALSPAPPPMDELDRLFLGGPGA